MTQVEPSEDSRAEREALVTPPRRKGCGCWTIVLVCLLTPLVLGAVGYGWWRWTSSARLERAIAAVREKGEPTTIEELNALYPATPESKQATDLWFAAAESAAMDSERSKRLGDFTYWLARPNGRHLEPYLEEHPTGADGLLSPETLKVAEDFLAGKESAFDAAQKAVEAGGTTRFLIADERASETVDRWERYRDLFELLGLETERRRSADDVAGVVEMIGTTLALAEMLREEPSPAIQRCRRIGVGVALDQIEKSLVRDELSDEDLADLQTRLEPVTFEPSLRPMLLAVQVGEIRRSRGLEPVDPKYVPYRYGPEANSALALELVAILAESSTDFVSARAGHFKFQEVGSSFGEGVGRDPISEFLWTVRYGEGLDRAFEHNYEWMSARLGEIDIDLTETAVACIRYRRARGELPPDLAALAPEYLQAIPQDVWIDEPVLFLASDKGFVVYGRNIDLEDNRATRSEYGSEEDWPLRIESDRYAPPPEPEYPADDVSWEESGVEAADAAEPGAEVASEEPEETEGAAAQP